MALYVSLCRVCWVAKQNKDGEEQCDYGLLLQPDTVEALN